MENLEDIFIEKFGEPVKVSGDEYKFYCPECGHKSLLANIELGVFHCFICSYGRGLKLGEHSESSWINKPKFVADKLKHLQVVNFLVNNLSLSVPHRLYLKSRGIINPERYGIASIPYNIDQLLFSVFDKDFLYESGFYSISKSSGKFTGWPCLKMDRIFIPIYSKGKYLGCKTRTDPFTFDTSSSNYLIPKGFALKNIFWQNKEFIGDVHVTEGELKAVAAAEYDIPIGGLSGINTIDSIIPVLSLGIKSKKIKRVFVVFDTEQDVTKKEAKAQAYMLSEKLNFSNVTIVTLPKKTDSLKMDLDRYLLEFGIDSYLNLCEDSWYNRDKILEFYKQFKVNKNGIKR